ncbi:hypothetical protein [Roseateles sp.]|uniref:hypothetical protein n=1 Tax=Roseateles sp. TaxID=1971397 RepID=UPI0039E84842
MSTSSTPHSHVYVLKLIPDEMGGSVLRGRLEHIASGRRHDFDSGVALIGCLHHEEQQVAREQRERGHELEHPEP